MDMEKIKWKRGRGRETRKGVKGRLRAKG